VIDVELFQRLTGDATAGALIGTRVYPVRAPQDAATPYVVWAMVSRVGDQALGGDVSSLVASRIQFGCYAGDYPAARALADAVRRSLASWNNPASAVKNTFQDNELDLSELDLNPPLIRIEQDWIITFIDT
jgi:hypothetical protein